MAALTKLTKSLTPTATDTEKPSHHLKTGFRNPWPSSQPPSLSSRVTWNPLEWQDEIHHSIPRIKVVDPDFDITDENGDKLRATWLGHASVMASLPFVGQKAVNILFDPIFSTRSSPTQWAGPSRRLTTPCKIAELPIIDIVCISHSHYDHLDEPTLTQLIAAQGKNLHFYVPLGLKSWIQSLPYPEDKIHELDWWDGHEFPLQDLCGENAGSKLKIVCTPAQHSSGRNIHNQDTTLWCSWIVDLQHENAESNRRLFFGGDTGYRSVIGGPTCPAFKEIGEKYGPFDLSFIPIWRGGTLSFISYMGLRLRPDALTATTHCTPDDAVLIHKDVKSKHTMAIHFATFVGSEDEATHPVRILHTACENNGVSYNLQDEGGFGVVDIGKLVVV